MSGAAEDEALTTMLVRTKRFNIFWFCWLSICSIAFAGWSFQLTSDVYPRQNHTECPTETLDLWLWWVIYATVTLACLPCFACTMCLHNMSEEQGISQLRSDLLAEREQEEWGGQASSGEKPPSVPSPDEELLPVAQCCTGVTFVIVFLFSLSWLVLGAVWALTDYECAHTDEIMKEGQRFMVAYLCVQVANAFAFVYTQLCLRRYIRSHMQRDRPPSFCGLLCGLRCCDDGASDDVQQSTNPTANQGADHGAGVSAKGLNHGEGVKW